MEVSFLAKEGSMGLGGQRKSVPLISLLSPPIAGVPLWRVLSSKYPRLVGFTCHAAGRFLGCFEHMQVVRSKEGKT